MTEAGLAFIKAMEEAKQRRYQALGLRPGEGGRFAPNMQGYEDAMQDMLRLLPLLSASAPYKPSQE